MTDDDIVKVLRAVEDGWVHHTYPFIWICAEEAQHLDSRTLQRALQQNLIRVEKNVDREPRPVRLTASGRARLAREQD